MTDQQELLTYYDDATGERTALTTTELGAWAAATSALLVEGCGLGRGSRVTVRLPVLGLAPHAGPCTEVPDGYRDYLAELRPYAAAEPPGVDFRPEDPASPDGTTYGEWDAVAAGVAQTHGIGAGDRVLIDAARSEQPVQWLLAPLSQGASIVLCANLDPAAVPTRAAAEGVTEPSPDLPASGDPRASSAHGERPGGRHRPA